MSQTIGSVMPSSPQPISGFGRTTRPSLMFCTAVLPLSPSKNQFKPLTFSKQHLSRNPSYSPASKRDGMIASVVTTRTEPVETTTIKKSEPVLVQPARKTYDGLYYLSGIDQNLMCPLELLSSYKGNGQESIDNVFKVVKKGLAEVLVHFYPLAGRLTITEDGSFMVNCTGEGVYFVEAFIDQDLDEFGDISTPNDAKLRQLLHIPEAKTILDMPLFTVQVTLFKCGGYVLAVSLNHCMMDGTALGQFVISWSELARGLPLSVPPFLDRSILKPSQVSDTEFQRGLFSKIDIEDRITIPPLKEKVYTSVYFGPEKLMQLKKTVVEEGIERLPTNFELLSAFMSRAIIRSLKVDKPQRKKLFFPINARPKFGAAFPQGYFGNCFWIAYMECNDEDEFIASSLSSLVTQVQEALRSVTAESIQKVLSYAEATAMHISPVNSYTFSSVTRMPMYKADFGFGEVKDVGFASLMENDIYFLPQKKVDRSTATAIVSMSPSAMKIFKESIDLKNLQRGPERTQ